MDGRQSLPCAGSTGAAGDCMLGWLPAGAVSAPTKAYPLAVDRDGHCDPFLAGAMRPPTSDRACRRDGGIRSGHVVLLFAVWRRTVLITGPIPSISMVISLPSKEGPAGTAVADPARGAGEDHVAGEQGCESRDCRDQLGNVEDQARGLRLL